MMERRKVLAAMTTLVFNHRVMGMAKESNYIARAEIDVIAEIKKLRIPTGPYAGGYEMAPDGALNWYFANLGLIPIIQYLSRSELYTYTRGYLELYLRHLNDKSTIKDVNFTFGRRRTDVFTLMPSDSDDSYAATFLSLAVRYVRASQDIDWWNMRQAKLKEIAYRNIALMQKPSGLTQVFQPPRSELNSLGYMMDNCECYRGLRDFASLLRDQGDTTDANYYDLVATGIVNGIKSKLFDALRSGFMGSDGDVRATADFYPGTTCQIFAQAFDVSELSSYYDKAWNYLNWYSPNWQDGRYDPYPWSILGFVASRRGQKNQAQAQMRSIERKFANARALVTINELGFYQRTKSVLADRMPV